MIFRGQAYGESIGEWWTTSRVEALNFAMSRGGNRNYVVLALDESDQEWLEKFEIFKCENSIEYRIPVDELRKRWRSATIISGAIDTKFVVKKGER